MPSLDKSKQESGSLFRKQKVAPEGARPPFTNLFVKESSGGRSLITFYQSWQWNLTFKHPSFYFFLSFVLSVVHSVRLIRNSPCLLCIREKSYWIGPFSSRIHNPACWPRMHPSTGSALKVDPFVICLLNELRKTHIAIAGAPLFMCSYRKLFSLFLCVPASWVSRTLVQGLPGVENRLCATVGKMPQCICTRTGRKEKYRAAVSLFSWLYSDNSNETPRDLLPKFVHKDALKSKSNK